MFLGIQSDIFLVIHTVYSYCRKIIGSHVKPRSYIRLWVHIESFYGTKKTKRFFNTFICHYQVQSTALLFSVNNYIVTLGTNSNNSIINFIFNITDDHLLSINNFQLV